MWKTSDGQEKPVPHSAVAVMTNVVKQTSNQNTAETVRLRFPQLMKFDIAQLQHVLGHTFRHLALLAEALTHGSAPLQSEVPFSAQLALVGDAAMQVFLGEKLWQYASFPTAATVYKGMPATHTFAVPEGSQVGEASARMTAEADPITCSSPEDMRCKLLACCNHVAYARTCVQLGISRMLCQSSDTLQTSLDKFTRSVKRAQTWRELVGRTAPPKALGDTFLACVGAVLLDSHFCSAIPLMQQHVDLCAEFFMADPPSEAVCVAEVPLVGVSEDIFVRAIQQAGTAIDSRALAAPPMKTDQAHFEAQVEKALPLKDFQIYDVDGEVLWGISPRSVQLRVQCADGGDESDGASFGIHGSDRDSPQVLLQDPPGDQGNVSSETGAVYCEFCEMWLNGPTQWEDHKIGKKHKKHVRWAKQKDGPVANANPPSKAKTQVIQEQNSDAYLQEAPYHAWSSQASGWQPFPEQGMARQW